MSKHLSMIKTKICLVIFLALSVFGCNKSEDEVYHGAIRNNLDKEVHLDFYPTMNDYTNGTNVLRSAVIAPHGSYEVPGDFETGTNLYLDYYTDDYEVTNWGGNVQFNVVSFSRDFGPLLAVDESSSGSARRIWLGGNRESATWKLYDYRYNQVSFWNQMANYQKNRQLILRKDFTGTYSFLGSDGSNKTMDFTYVVSGPGPDISNIFLQFENIPSGFYNVSQAFSGTEVYKDTVAASSFFPPEGSGGTPYSMYFYRLP